MAVPLENSILTYSAVISIVSNIGTRERKSSIFAPRSPYSYTYNALHLNTTEENMPGVGLSHDNGFSTL